MNGLEGNFFHRFLNLNKKLNFKKTCIKPRENKMKMEYILTRPSESFVDLASHLQTRRNKMKTEGRYQQS